MIQREAYIFPFVSIAIEDASAEQVMGAEQLVITFVEVVETRGQHAFNKTVIASDDLFVAVLNASA